MPTTVNMVNCSCGQWNQDYTLSSVPDGSDTIEVDYAKVSKWTTGTLGDLDRRQRPTHRAWPLKASALPRGHRGFLWASSLSSLWTLYGSAPRSLQSTYSSSKTSTSLSSQPTWRLLCLCSTYLVLLFIDLGGSSVVQDLLGGKNVEGKVTPGR